MFIRVTDAYSGTDFLMNVDAVEAVYRYRVSEADFPPPKCFPQSIAVFRREPNDPSETAVAYIVEDLEDIQAMIEGR
jgi:hypothetical protein